MEKEKRQFQSVETWKDNEFHAEGAGPEAFAADLKLAADSFGWSGDWEMLEKFAEAYKVKKEPLNEEDIADLVSLSEGINSITGEGLHVVADLKDKSRGFETDKIDTLFEQAKINQVIQEPEKPEEQTEEKLTEEEEILLSQYRITADKKNELPTPEQIEEKRREIISNRGNRSLEEQRAEEEPQTVDSEKTVDVKVPIEGEFEQVEAQNERASNEILEDLKRISGVMEASERELLIENLKKEGISLSDDINRDTPQGKWERNRLKEAVGYVEGTYTPHRGPQGNIGWESKGKAKEYLEGLGVNFEESRQGQQEPETETPTPRPAEQVPPPSGNTYFESIINMEPGPKRDGLISGWLDKNGETADPELVKRALSSLGATTEAAKHIEIPTEPDKYRRFIRTRIREQIRLATNQNQLTLKAIEDNLITELTREMGLDPSKGFRVELFPRELRELSNFREIKTLVENEIEARANLRYIQIQEEMYKSYQDRGPALAKFIADMKGTESNPASPSTISRKTYSWLKKIESLDDPEGATTAKVDAALSILLKLGNNKKDPEEGPWHEDFNEFVGRPQNIYHPEYDPIDRDRAMDMIADKYGEDARDIAWQLFQAYKEEGNYTWTHYLNGLFKFSESRYQLAKNLAIYTGSQRIIVEKQEELKARIIKEKGNLPEEELENLVKEAMKAEMKPEITDDMTDEKKAEIRAKTFKPYADEIGYLALSGLRVPGKESKDKEAALWLYYERAIDGKFLQETELVNTSLVKNTPEVDSFTTIKSGDKAKTAIVTIGTLGAETDKVQAIPKAQTSLSDLRSSLEALVDIKVLPRQVVDRQLWIECQNVLWELSVDNPLNNRDLSTQTRDRTKFLLPSGLSSLMMVFGGHAGKSAYKILDPRYYSDIRDRVQKMREKTFQIFEKGPDEGGMVLGEKDGVIIKKEEEDLKFVELPLAQGQPLIRKTADTVLRATETVTKPMQKATETFYGGKPPKWLKKPLI